MTRERKGCGGHGGRGDQESANKELGHCLSAPQEPTGA